MPRRIVDAEIEAYKPGDSAPYVTIPNDRIESIETDERAQDALDSGRIQLDNDDSLYTGANAITSGDKLVVKTRLVGESSLSHWWTAMVRSPTHTLRGASLQDLEIDATDFVFTVLDWRLAYESFDDVQVSGSSGAILDQLVDDGAPELGTSQIAAVPETTDAFYNGRKLLDIVRQDLAPIADAIVGNDGTDLVFEPVGDVNAKHTFEPSDVRGDVDVEPNDDELHNLVRVDGGTDHAVDDEQPTQSSLTTVTQSTRLTTQIETRKSEIARVQIYTDPISASADGVVVRLQADRGGSPVDVGDTTSDIARKTLAKDFLADGGFTTFILPAHTLPPNENPWLIVEADGSAGQDVGTDGSGNLTYRAEYPYPLLTRLPFRSSQDEYRRRDHRIKDESLETEAAVRDLASSHGRHHAEPELTMDCNAETVRAHNLRPAEAVDMQGWTAQIASVGGKWIVLRRATRFDGESNLMTTELTLQDADTI